MRKVSVFWWILTQYRGGILDENEFLSSFPLIGFFVGIWVGGMDRKGFDWLLFS